MMKPVLSNFSSPSNKKSIAGFLLSTLLLTVISLNTFANPAEKGDKGISEYEKGNLIIGMQLMQEAADDGYAPAQARLAYVYDQAEEDERAFELFERAAEQGNPEGQFGLARMYAKGEGTAVNMELARKWFSAAVENNHAEATRVVGQAHENGSFGYPINPELALSMYHKAADMKDTQAMIRLAEIYRNGELGAAPDKNKAKEFETKIGKTGKDSKKK